MVRIVNLFLLLLVAVTLAQIDDEFYCRAKEDKWSICRRCLETDKKCSQDPEGCHCENIQVADPKQNDKLIGGSDCNEGFCYISVESSTCSDKWDGYDPWAYTLEPNSYWHQGSTTEDKLFRSKVACENKETFNTGNEAILEGVKITGNTEDLELDSETSKDCKEECSSMIGECGSWSYDNSEGICYLHTGDSCCGQFGKREKISSFTSGYVCPHCWSTKANTDCPCSLRERSQTPGIAMSSGGDTHCTGEIELHPNFIDGDRKEKIIRKKGRWFRKAEWEIRRNTNRENLKTKTATLTDGNCCWTITGSRNQEIVLNYRNPVAELDFYVKKLKSHRCGSKK